MAWGLTALFGLGLFGLWLVGIMVGATVWMTWLELVAGLAAFGITLELARSAAESSRRRASYRAAAPLGLGVVLLILGGIGVATNASLALTWGTLALAIAFTTLGLVLTRGLFPRLPIGAALPFDEQFGSSHRYLYHPGAIYPGNWIGLGEFSGRGPRHYRREDSRLREEICDRLTLHGDLDASGMTVDVREGVVVLSGEVADRRARRLAEEIAESAIGVKDVRNELRVSGASGGASPARVA